MIRLTAVIEQEGQAPKALTHESNARSVTIGRDPSCDFQLPLTTVSRQHVKISADDGIYTVEDLGSTHGSSINGRALEAGQRRVLRQGDVIELTRAKITCTIEDDKVVSAEPGEHTQAIAARAVQGILGRLGEAQQEGPHLRIISGAGEGTRFPLTAGTGEWVLGRSSDCECVLPDPNVSRRHALVKRDWNGFTIQDLGSKNGIQVGDRLVARPRRLRDRDEITIGPIRLVFVDPDADLLSALKDVPGFNVEEPVSEEMEAPPAAEEAHAEGSLGLEGPPLEVPDAEAAAQVEEEAALAQLDPELLENPQPTLPMDWLVLGGVGLLVLLAGLALIALF